MLKHLFIAGLAVAAFVALGASAGLVDIDTVVQACQRPGNC